MKIKIDSEERELKYYKYEDAEKAGLFSKTQWGQRGRKLKPDAVPAGYRRSLHVDCVLLYPENETQPKRVQVQRPAQALPTTPENVALALFELNRAAKRRRDATERTYGMKKHGLVQLHKRAKIEYYKLKDGVLKKAETEGHAQLRGLHYQTRIVKRREYEPEDEDIECTCDCHDDPDPWLDDEELARWCDCPCHQPSRYIIRTYREERLQPLALYEFAGFRFHRPVTEAEAEQIHSQLGESGEIKNLGAWEAEAKPPTGNMAIKDAIATLKAYLDKRE